MKHVFLSLSVIAVMAFSSCKEEAKSEENSTATAVTTEETADEATIVATSFGVRGNCGMCKKTIEKAATGIDGVTNANWDKDKKNIAVTYDSNKTNEMVIHKAIASSGYDTEKVAADATAYNELPGCCQYDHEMKMNQMDAEKTNDHEGHDH